MTVNQIVNISDKAKVSLQHNFIMQSFKELNPLLKELHEWWAINRQDELQQIYQQMVRYLIEGVNDTNQQSIFNRLKSDIYYLIDNVTQVLLSQNSSEFEYRQQRYVLSNEHLSLNSAVEIFERYELYKELHNEISENNVELEKSLIERADVEYQQQLLFNHFWLTNNYSEEEFQFLFSFIVNEKIDVTPKLLLVSAVTLSVLRCFNHKKLLWIISVCDLPKDEIRQRAIIALLLIMSRYPDRIMIIPQLLQEIERISQDTLFIDELENSYLQLVRTSETDSISKRVKEELLPEMMKLGPKLKDKIQNESFNSSDDMEEKNPEWESILDQDGVSDKIKEFGDLQMDGADVYVSTFAPLKSFPFFNETANWFMPFDSNDSHIQNLFTNNSSLFHAFVKSPFLCNSDKYSFCLSLMQMPEVQQNMMSDAFKQESEQMEEALKDEEKLNKHISTKSISNQYIQDLYRFYTINPHHTDFKNPLKETLEFYKSPLFSIIFKEESRRKRISEFFFSKNLYVESLAQFLALINQGLSDVSSYQKIAFCYQQLMEYDNAIEYYQKAELLDPNNSWTLTRLAYCYRRIQQFEQAMNIYHKLQELYPEQLQYQSYLAGCYYELGKFDEALNLYYKLDYLQPNQPKNWRFIAWCSFVAGKLEQSEKYYAKLVALPKPDSVDFLNAGHLAWIQNKLQLAHHYYLSAKVVMKDSNKFTDLFMRDAKYLAPYQITVSTMALMLDSLELFPDKMSDV